jgi:drug/metabolite transporter (DMT)-like permease
MGEIVYSILYICSVFIASFSQILLKKSAVNHRYKGKKTYLNLMVIFAYLLFFVCTLFSIYALKVVPLSSGAIYESLAYIFIPLLGFFFLKEKITKKHVLGISIIFIGVILCSI